MLTTTVSVAEVGMLLGGQLLFSVDYLDLKSNYGSNGVHLFYVDVGTIHAKRNFFGQPFVT